MYVYTGHLSISSTYVTDEICFTHFILSWNLTSDLMTCRPIFYILRKSPDEMMEEINTANTFYNFTGLTPGTNYTISIEPFNRLGGGNVYTDSIRSASDSKCLYVCKLKKWHVCCDTGDLGATTPVKL